MKTKNLNRPLTLSCALCLALALPAMAGDTNTPATNPAVAPATADADELGFDFYNGKSYRIGKITEVKPTYVAVIYADVPGGRKIPRRSLPDKLTVLYP